MTTKEIKRLLGTIDDRAAHAETDIGLLRLEIKKAWCALDAEANAPIEHGEIPECPAARERVGFADAVMSVELTAAGVRRLRERCAVPDDRYATIQELEARFAMALREIENIKRQLPPEVR